MERIAPLAKILAEANGIEWEHLKGTGAGGMIVEQDILDYLSRVMSGEAEPPSTPVDAPPPDWNGEDLPGGGMFDANMLSQAGVESDIADFVSQSRPAAPAAPAQPEPALTQDDFELDDTQDDDLMAPAAAAPVAPAPAAAPRSPFDIPPVTPSAPAAAPAQPEPTPPAAPAPAAPAAGGLGSLLSRLYHKDEPAAPTLPTPPVPTRPEAGTEARSSFSGFGQPAASAPVTNTPAPAFPSSFEVPPVQLKDTARNDVAQPAPAMPTPSFGAQRDDVAPAAQPLTARFDTDAVTPEQTEPALPTPVQDTEPVAAVTEPVISEPVEPVQPAPTQPAASEPQVTERVSSEPEVAQSAAASTPRDAVWFGTYLRRDADVAQLHDLRQQLSEALEREVPLSLLVARAAQRHAAALGLDSVAMRDMDRGISRQMGGQVGSSVSLRDALVATDDEFSGTPDLLVVDAGKLDMDDLHYPETLTLSVGRVQNGRAALSLQGDVDPEKAARFLASVAQTLEKPVILLV